MICCRYPVSSTWFSASGGRLVFIDGICADNVATVEGAHLHQRADHEQKTEVRRNVRVARGVWLRSLRLGLYGRGDVIEFVQNESRSGGSPSGISLPGTSGTWTPFPVEYKRGRSRREEGYEVQLCAQGMCLEEMLGIQIRCGAVFYGQSRRRVDVMFDADLRARTERAGVRLREVLREGSSPRFEPGPKCRACSLVGECLPPILSHGSAKKYLAGVIAHVEKEARCGGS